MTSTFSCTNLAKVVLGNYIDFLNYSDYGIESANFSLTFKVEVSLC
jgi:hypothetical protein